MIDDAAQKPPPGHRVGPAAMIARKPPPGTIQKLLLPGLGRHLPTAGAGREHDCYAIVIAAENRAGIGMRGGSPHAWPACSDLA
jgi:hypothetical protein